MSRVQPRHRHAQYKSRGFQVITSLVPKPSIHQSFSLWGSTPIICRSSLKVFCWVPWCQWYRRGCLETFLCIRVNQLMWLKTQSKALNMSPCIWGIMDVCKFSLFVVASRFGGNHFALTADLLTDSLPQMVRVRWRRRRKWMRGRRQRWRALVHGIYPMLSCQRSLLLVRSTKGEAYTFVSL